MIDNKTAKAIKKEIGVWHISKLVNFSDKRGYKKSNGSSYKGPEFSMVLNGDRNTEEIKNIIIECWEHYIKKNEKAQRKKTELLERSKKNV